MKKFGVLRTLRALPATIVISLPVGIALAGTLALSQAAAQMVNFKQYTSADGLPRSEVLGLKQDRLGYMWFGTLSGLSRFNGREFRNYTKDDGLSSNSIFDIDEDSKGRLVIATSGGLCIMEGGAFRCYREKDGLVNDNARTLAADSVGGVWVGTVRGLSYVINGTIRNYTVADGLPIERVTRVVVDVQKNVWVATAKGLARLEGKKFVLESPGLIGAVPIQFIAPTRRGLLIGVESRLYLREGTTIVPVAEGQIPDSTVLTDGAMDHEGTIWVATRKGALRVRNGHVEHLGRSNGMQTELINRVLLDREGDVWFGTEGGANEHVPGPFRTYTPGQGLPNQFVRALQLDTAGRLWVGTRNGIAVRDGEQFKPIPLPGVPDDRVFGLTRTPTGGLLIGTRRGLIWYEGGRVRQVYREKDGLPADVVYCLIPDQDGSVWIGTDRGLARWKSGKVTKVEHKEFSTSSIVSMKLDSRGRLWLGRLAGGIAILDGDSVQTLGIAQGATDQTVLTMDEDKKGGMWVGTNGDGVLRIDDSGIRRFTIKDGLSSNFIWQALADSRGDIWLYGNRGLDRFSGDNLAHYGKGSGLTELEGTINAAVEDREGNLWFGTGSGIVRYVRGLDVSPAIPPPVYIEEALSGTKPFANVPGGVKLSRGVVEFHFSSPSYRDESTLFSGTG